MSGEPEVHPGVLARVLRLYAGPPEPRPLGARDRSRHRHARAIAVAAGLAVAVVATAAVFSFARGGGDRMPASIASNGCVTTLTVGGNRYVARPLRLQPARALGNAVLRPCASRPVDVAVVALAGIDARRAVGLRGVPTRIYVSTPCARTSNDRLLSCLRSPR